MKELIAAIQDEKYEFVVGEGVMESAHNYALDKAIELIETMLAGKVIVPVEPTDEMVEAGGCHIKYISIAPLQQAREIYKDMLSTIGEQDA